MAVFQRTLKLSLLISALLALTTAGLGAAELSRAPAPISSLPANATVAPGNWRELSPQNKKILAPLSAQWDGFSITQKRKWLGIVERYPSLAPQEQASLQRRMSEWASLSAAEREKARQQYNKLRSAPADDRRSLEEKWQLYKALPSEEKQALKAAPKPIPKAPTATKRAPKVVQLAPARPKTGVANKTAPRTDPPPARVESAHTEPEDNAEDRED